MKLKMLIQKLEDILATSKSQKRKQLSELEAVHQKLNKKRDKFTRKLAAATDDVEKERLQRKIKAASQQIDNAEEAMTALKG